VNVEKLKTVAGLGTYTMYESWTAWQGWGRQFLEAGWSGVLLISFLVKEAARGLA